MRSLLGDESAAKHLFDCCEEMLLCTDQEGEGVGHQPGEGGGPTFQQIGVVSWGRGCGEKNYPGVYARLG